VSHGLLIASLYSMGTFRSDSVLTLAYCERDADEVEYREVL
jgi:hypothetical protein